jgi:hypothetical protein
MALGTDQIDWLGNKLKKSYDWSQKELAPRVFGDMELDGTPTAPSNGSRQEIPEGGFKPTTGNQTIDSVIDLFR